MGETKKEVNNSKINLKNLQDHISELAGNGVRVSNLKSLFISKGANEWLKEAKSQPIPKMLFDKFWFEGELCILFADTNMGKSILAVQIGDSISRGQAISGFILEADPQRVLYFDFELSLKQFEARYSNQYKNHYKFSENLARIEIDPDADIPDKTSFEDYLMQSLEEEIIRSGAEILIIDNLTYLKSDTEKAKEALPLMKLLKNLKSKYNLSILALAHTPKRDLSKPITRNDVHGSKTLMNFCDSSFAIGESHKDKNLRYLKQIKARNTEIIFDAENVALCTIEKPSNFLHFVYQSQGTEADYLKPPSDKDKVKLEESVIALQKQRKSYRDIAISLDISHMTVKRIIDKQRKEKGL